MPPPGGTTTTSSDGPLRATVVELRDWVAVEEAVPVGDGTFESSPKQPASVADPPTPSALFRIDRRLAAAGRAV